MATAKQHAFLMAYRPHHEAFMRYCGALARSASDQEDLAQDVLLSAFTHFDRIKQKESLLHYLVRAARNRHISQLRKQQVATTESLSVMLSAQGADADVLVDAELLKQAMEQLPEDQRDVLVLFEVMGFSIKEIAAQHETTVGATKTKISRARKRLREMLTDRRTGALVIGLIGLETEATAGTPWNLFNGLREGTAPVNADQLLTQALHPQGVSWLGTTWQQVTQWVPGIASSITPLLVAGLILTLPKDSGSEETSVAEDPMIKLGAISPTFSQSYPNQIQVPAYAPMIDTTGHPAAPVPPATPTMTEPTLPASPSAPVAPSPDSPTLQVLSGTLLLPDFPDEDDWLSRLMPPKLPALPVEELLPSLPPLPPLPALPELEPLAGLTHQPSEPSPSSKPSRPSRPSRASGQSLQLGQVLSGWLSSKHEPEQSVVADQNVPAEPVTRLESEVATEEGNIDALKRQLWRHLLDDELIKNKRGLSLFTFKEGGFQFNGEEVPGHLKEHYFELFDEWGEMHSPKEGDSARHPFIRENGVVALHPQFIAVGRITTEGFFGAMSGTLDMMEVESWGVKALPPEQ